MCPVTGRAISAKRPTGLAPGELVEGKYQILREIGRGAMGVVYEAEHVALQRRVAVKTLLEEVSADPQLGVRFEREARAASAIGHPNIIDVFDLGRTKDGLLFMVMELLDGDSLLAVLKRQGTLPLPLATHLLAQVLGGLSAAHKHGIVHRDLKPDNIFVLDTEERPNFVKIVDFGISKMVGPKNLGPTATAKVAGTMVGSVLGTPLYMSPEQAVGQVSVIDHRTDIYSAGVVLYEMLCGRTPFVGENYTQILGSILEGKYPPPRSLRPEIPPELEAAIVRALDRDMEKRFPTAAAMRTAISGDAAERTPGPVLLPPSTSDALHISLATLHGSEGESPIPPPLVAPAAPPLVAPAALPAKRENRRPRSGGDLFAPPPESEALPALETEHDHPLHGRFKSAEPRLDPSERSPSPDHAPAMASASPPWRGWVWLMVAGIVAMLAVGVRFAWSALRPGEEVRSLFQLGDKSKVILAVEPKHASVQVDHIPVAIGELPLDPGSARTHMLNAAAPGRVTRRLSFTARPGLKLVVRLGRTIPVPTATDPMPLPAELAADYPDSPRTFAEIDSAFAKLDRYADCLAMSGDAEAKRSANRSRLRGEELGFCRRSIAAAATALPAMPELEAAAESYLAAAQSGQKLEALHRMAATFRAEYLAARTAWQMEELSRQGKDEGQNAAWHMRRVALASQAWVRARKAGYWSGQAGDAQRTKLDEYLQSFLDYTKSAQREVARTSGVHDFIREAQELVALAQGQGGRRATEFASLDACRKLLTAFDALILN